MKEVNFDLLPIPEIQSQKEKESNSAAQLRASKMNFNISGELIEKIKDYAYWEGLTQQDVATRALELFMRDKKVKSRPEALKRRPRPGRKPKHSY